jgi:hypothetical protein
VGPPRRGVRHLGRNLLVELNSESRARQPTTRAWAIIRRADRSDRLAGQPASWPNRRSVDRPDGVDRIHQPQEQAVIADAR